MMVLNLSPLKRRRPALACQLCRRRKVKCDRDRPCGMCSRSSSTCTYIEDGRTKLNEYEQPIQMSRLPALTEFIGQDADILNQRQSLDNIADQSVPGDVAETGSTEKASGSYQQHGTFPTAYRRTEPPKNTSASGIISGSISKTRIFGRGHWMSTMLLSERLSALDPITPSNGPATPEQTIISSIPGISDVLMNCKQLARDIKSQRPSRGPLPAGIHQTFPDPAEMEQLVALYFDSFESCYRILHLPSFRVEYDAYVRDPSAAKTSFVAKLLLVMSTAATLLEDTSLKQELRAKARSWIHVAQGWLSAPIEKDRLSVDGLQVYCLLLLARQVNLVGADLVWISAGSLMHMAIQMGFHQDPDHLGGISRLQKEIRRRLWYTILEMNIQAALDSGMRPMVNAADFDTRPPSDISDEDLDNVIQGASPENAGSIPTRASFHCLLASSVLLRLEATKFINALQEEPSYDRVIRLGEELALICRNATVSIDHHKRVAKDLWPTEFPYSCCDHFHRRFLLCLHLPYAAKVAHNPMYSYSSKAGLEAALALVSLLDDKIYRRLLLVGGGMFRDILTRGAILVFLELMTQLENDGSSFVKKRNQARREPLLKDAGNIVEYVKDRLWHGETNVKGYVFVSMAMGQVDAMISDTSTKDAIVKSASEALLVCHDILKSTATNLLPTITTGVNVAYEIGSNSMAIPSVDDLDFDFMNDGNIDFELAGSWFIRQWDEEARL